QVRLGNTPGPVKVRVFAPNGPAASSATFNLTNTLTASLTAISGSGQSATVGQAFAGQLVAQVVDPNGQAVPNTPVTFAVTSGNGLINPSSVTSDAQGFVRTTVTAGNSPGSVTVTATLQNSVVTYTLSVTPIGPMLDPSGVVNAATGQPGISPGSIAT